MRSHGSLHGASEPRSRRSEYSWKAGQRVKSGGWRCQIESAGDWPRRAGAGNVQVATQVSIRRFSTHRRKKQRKVDVGQRLRKSYLKNSDWNLKMRCPCQPLRRVPTLKRCPKLLKVVLFSGSRVPRLHLPTPKSPIADLDQLRTASETSQMRGGDYPTQQLHSRSIASQSYQSLPVRMVCLRG